MAQVQCEIDSVRVAAACPELTLILKSKDSDGYLPIWISPPQADILADQLHGRCDKRKDLDLLLGGINAADSNIECARVYLEGNTFFAKVLFSRHPVPCEVSCPIGLALALAVRADAPILVDDALFDKAGVRLT
jgi:bifunctional DNase/RNase